MVNKLILYCRQNERAVFWDVCRVNRCFEKTKCLCQRIIARAGTEKLFSHAPVRIQSAEQIDPILEALKQPPSADAPMTQPQSAHQEPIRRTQVLVRTPVKVPENIQDFQTFNDMLGDTISEELKNL